MGVFHNIALTILVSALGTNAVVKFTLVNNCPEKVWPGWQGNPLVEGGGTELEPGASKTIEMPDGTASARIWPRTKCTGADGSLKCETGDCGPNVKCNGTGGAPPASLAEFTLAKNKGENDTYDTSYVDGYNVMTIMKPVEGTFDPAAKKPAEDNFCITVGECKEDLKTAASTPQQLKIPSESKPQEIKAVLGLCGVGGAQCCQANGQAEKCPPSAFAPETKKQYDEMKANCPNSYLYDYDDKKSTFVCRGKDKPSPDYQVSFCSDKPGQTPPAGQAAPAPAPPAQAPAPPAPAPAS